MEKNNRPTWLLHVSDFHIKEENKQFAKWVLSRFADCLASKNQPIDYILHSGDVIDSKYYGTGFSEDTFNSLVRLISVNKPGKNGVDASDCQDSSTAVPEVVEKSANTIRSGIEALTEALKNLPEKLQSTLTKSITEELQKTISQIHNEEGWLRWAFTDGNENECSPDIILDKIVEIIAEINQYIDSMHASSDNEEQSNLIKSVSELWGKYTEIRQSLRDGLMNVIAEAETNANSSESAEIINQIISFLAKKRFEFADEILIKFAEELDLTKKRFVFCCGNHDVLRLKGQNPEECDQNQDCSTRIYSEDSQKLRRNAFDKFAEKYCAIKENCFQPFAMHGFKICSIDTNYASPKSNRNCASCRQCNQPDNLSSENDGLLSIIIGHKPLYEMCEYAILPYNDGIPDFLRWIRSMLGDNGIYICGDKHTRSISGSPMFGISHYLGGSPIVIPDMGKTSTIEYNLIEIADGKVARERLAKIRISRKQHPTEQYPAEQYPTYQTGGNIENSYFDSIFDFECSICPQNNFVSSVYNICKKYINERTFIAYKMNRIDQATWDNLSAVYFDKSKNAKIKEEQNIFYSSFLRYRKEGNPKQLLGYTPDVFQSIIARIKEKMDEEPIKEISFGRNILNLRGDYGCGKSTFLGYLYIELLEAFNAGKIDFIPVIFSLNNQEVKKEVEAGERFCDAAKHAFVDFFDQVEQLTRKEELKTLFIIDGLDDQDCWSYTSEDSIGRGIIDILAQNTKAWFIMSFTQHRLPLFKNTMPVMKIGDKSDLLYFNSTEVYAKADPENDINDDLRKMVEAYIILNDPYKDYDDDKQKALCKNKCNQICEKISLFCARTINLRFLTEHRIEYPQSAFYSVIDRATALRYFIDRQFGICYEELGYNFVKYAPTMAYLFAYHGYTFERFMHIAKGSRDNDIHDHLIGPFAEYRSMLYKAFLFIKTRKDAREYLIALHYNSELRYYTENPSMPISRKSILNEFIYQSTSIIIRKLWTDPNKLIIVCNSLLQRECLPSTTVCMLIYCVANNMYMDRLQRGIILEKLISYKPYYSSTTQEYIHNKEIAAFEIDPNLTVKMQTDLFLLYSLERAKILFSSDHDLNSLISRMLYLGKSGQPEENSTKSNNQKFRQYNQTYQMLFYGDQSIHGHDKVKQLDLLNQSSVGKGFDIYYTYVQLSFKIRYALERDAYRLLDFDLLTLCQLLTSRIEKTKDEDGSQSGGGKKVSGQEYEYFQRNVKSLGIIKKVCKMVDKRMIQVLGDGFDKAKVHNNTVDIKNKICGLSIETTRRLMSEYLDYYEKMTAFTVEKDLSPNDPMITTQ